MSNTRRHTLYSARCFHCRTSQCNELGILLWPDKDATVNAALEEGWLMHRGRLYCPTCIADKQHLPPSYRRNYKRLKRNETTNKQRTL